MVARSFAAFGIGAAVVVLGLGLGACSARQPEPPRSPATPAQVRGGAEIAIRRGPDMGLGLVVKPPYAVGPFSSMTIRRGRITGIHCGGGFAVRAEGDRIHGYGPGGGMVEMEVWGDATELNAEGLWNGAYGRFEVSPDVLKVSLAMGPTRVQGGGVRHARYRTFEFRRGADGQFRGDFGGRPRLGETRQEVSLMLSDRLQAYLTREEMLAILMTLFSGAESSSRLEPFGCGARG